MKSGMGYHAFGRIVCLLVLAGLLAGCVPTTYLKMNPPPDADKPNPANDLSCWLATASNMLAGAGYGNGLVVRHHQHRHLAGRFGDHGVHFARHDGGACLARGQLDLAQAGLWP